MNTFDEIYSDLGWMVAGPLSRVWESAADEGASNYEGMITEAMVIGHCAGMDGRPMALHAGHTLLMDDTDGSGLSEAELLEVSTAYKTAFRGASFMRGYKEDAIASLAADPEGVR